MADQYLYPPALQYKRLFKKEKLRKQVLERTVGNVKLKKTIPIFSTKNTCVELLFFCANEAKAAFLKLGINDNQWQEEFKNLLETTLAELYQTMIDGRMDNNHNFAQDAGGFDQTIKYFAQRFCADPFARKNMVH